MKKKLVATAVACVLASSCLFAVAACSDGATNGKESSVQVTAEQWEEAFSKTRSATNFTAKITTSESNTNSTASDDIMNCYYNGEAFAADISFKNVEGTETEEVEAKTYAVKDNDLWYTASYSDAEEDWYVSSQVNLFNLQIIFSAFAAEYSTSAEYTETQTIDKLYSSFTFSEGVYKAKLYYNGDPNSLTPVPECQVEVKINDGGYVTFIGISATIEYEAYSSAVSSSYTYSKFGTTTVTEDAEAKQEIEDYKAENSQS